jgi:hypothetical protein
MYTPDYTLAHLVAFQIRAHFDKLGAAAAAAASGAPSADGSAAAAKGLPAAAREAGRQPALGKEFERVAQIGTVTPNEWMRQAVGAPLSATPLVEAAEKALTQLK